tara:strand:+ start:538 stop:1758 length:1221 start_codon:yes stop_codon:yes gene_type:complete
MSLYNGHDEWWRRPLDDSFWNLDELAVACAMSKRNALEATADLSTCRFTSDFGDEDRRGLRFVDLSPDSSVGRSRMSYHGFGRCAEILGAPVAYLRGLPERVAVDCLEAGRERLLSRSKGSLIRTVLYESDTDKAGAVVRDIGTRRSDSSRVWDLDVVKELFELQENGWSVAPPLPAGLNPSRIRVAEKADAKSGGCVEGQTIAPGGLFRSDHDVTAFMVNTGEVIDDGAGGLLRGLVVWNSEVWGQREGPGGLMRWSDPCSPLGIAGGQRLWVAEGLFSPASGNHTILWTIQSRAAAAALARRGTIQSRAAAAAALIRRAKNLTLGTDLEEVIDHVASNHSIPGPVVRAACRLAEENEDGDPRSAWGIVQGLGRVAQECPYTDERLCLDLAAGEVLESALKGFAH